MAKQFGVSGNRPVWNQLFTGEHISALDGSSGRAIYDEMARCDAQIGAVTLAITLPILGNTYAVDPASAETRDIEIAEFVEDNLMRRMSMTWRDTLRHILLMHRYGFSVFEKLYRRSADDGKIRLHKLDPRLPPSITGWTYKGDTLDYIEQMGADGQTYKLPIKRCVVFTQNREGDNWEGISSYRSCYGSWLIKNELIKIEAIKQERYGVGLPVATAPEGVYADSDAWTEMETLLQDLHSNEVGYLIKPMGWELEILTPKTGTGGGTDAKKFIKDLNEQISVAFLAQFLQLGTTETGSRALGSSFVDFFLMALQHTADYIVEVLNRFVVRELVDYNWSDVTDYPTLRAAKVKELDYQTLAALQTAGVITADGEVEDAVRVGLGLPERPEDEEPAPEKSKPKEKPEDKPEDEEPEEAPPEPEEEPETEASHSHVQFAEPPEEIAEFVQFAVIESDLDDAIEELLDAVLAIREQQTEQLVRQIVAGKAVRNLTVPDKKDMYDDVVRAFRQQIKAGRAQVRDETKRQNASAKFADPIADDVFVDFVLEELSLMVDGAGEKLKAVIAKIALDLQKAGFAGDALRAELDRVIPQKIGATTWKDLVGTSVNQGWGHGRHLELIKLSDDVERYERYGILDRNLCDVCRSKDVGTTHASLTPDDPDFRVPDSECEGGPGKCRCIIVAIMKREEAA